MAFMNVSIDTQKTKVHKRVLVMPGQKEKPKKTPNNKKQKETPNNLPSLPKKTPKN